MKNRNRLILCVTLIIVAAFLLGGCQILNDAAQLQEYDFGTDKIPTINSIVGERKVRNIDTSTTNGVPQKQYTYESETVLDDLIMYTMTLRGNGWVVTQSYNLEVSPGSAQLAKNSADSGQILVLSIAYESDAYAIKITKCEGTLDMG